MNDPAVIAAAVVLMLSSLGGTAVLIINAWSASKDRREAARERLQQLTISQSVAQTAVDTLKKTDTLVESTAKIHELTNSTNSNLQKALELKESELQGIKALLAQMVEEKRTTAEARVRTDMQAAAPSAGSPSGGTHLKNIDAQTAETASNTAKTEATVQDLKDAT